MKTVLKYEDDYDFSLIGISCHAKDYRLSWQINKALNLDLKKVEMPEDQSAEIDDFIPMSEFYNEDNHMDYVLIPNKYQDRLWFPELSNLDYLLKISGPGHREEADDCRGRIQGLELILATFSLDPNALKSKSNLMF